MPGIALLPLNDPSGALAIKSKVKKQLETGLKGIACHRIICSNDLFGLDLLSAFLDEPPCLPCPLQVELLLLDVWALKRHPGDVVQTSALRPTHLPKGQTPSGRISPSSYGGMSHSIRALAAPFVCRRALEKACPHPALPASPCSCRQD